MSSDHCNEGRREELLAGLAERLKLPVDVIEEAVSEDDLQELVILFEAEERGLAHAMTA